MYLIIPQLLNLIDKYSITPNYNIIIPKNESIYCLSANNYATKYIKHKCRTTDISKNIKDLCRFASLPILKVLYKRLKSSHIKLLCENPNAYKLLVKIYNINPSLLKWELILKNSHRCDVNDLFILEFTNSVIKKRDFAFNCCYVFDNLYMLKFVKFIRCIIPNLNIEIINKIYFMGILDFSVDEQKREKILIELDKYIKRCLSCTYYSIQQSNINNVKFNKKLYKNNIKLLDKLIIG